MNHLRYRASACSELESIFEILVNKSTTFVLEIKLNHSYLLISRNLVILWRGKVWVSLNSTYMCCFFGTEFYKLYKPAVYMQYIMTLNFFHGLVSARFSKKAMHEMVP